MTPPRTALLFAALSLLGCGSKYVVRVPDAMVEKLPYESRIELLEAENDLAVAVDRQDEAENEVLRTKKAIRRAKEQLDAAKDEVGSAEDAQAKEVAQLALDEADAKLGYLRARQQVNLKNQDLAELDLTCALSRYELSRLEVARKAKVEGSEKLEVSEFEARSHACEAALKAGRTELSQTLGAEAEKAKAAWEEHRTRLAKKTFDARASPFVE